MIKPDPADATSASLRKGELEGHACRARRTMVDCPNVCIGRDKRVPPKSGADE